MTWNRATSVINHTQLTKGVQKMTKTIASVAGVMTLGTLPAWAHNDPVPHTHDYGAAMIAAAVVIAGITAFALFRKSSKTSAK